VPVYFLKRKEGKMKSKLIKIYQYRKGGQLFINATGIDDNGDFYLKSPPRRYGRVLPRSATDEEIGRTIREVFLNCD